MRKTFAGLAMLLMLLVVLEFYFAAVGAFDSAPKSEAFGPHAGLGFLILLYALLLPLVAALARMPGRIITVTGLIAGLVILQPVIAGVADGFGDASSTRAGELVFGLHAINGLAVVALAGALVRGALRHTGFGVSSARAENSDDIEVSGSAP